MQSHAIEVPDKLYRVPADLRRTIVQPRRIIMLGSCLSEAFVSVVEKSGCAADFMLMLHQPNLPPRPPLPLSEYDFQIVQIPLRGSVLPDMAYRRLSYDDVAGHERLFKESRDGLERHLEASLQWNRDHGIVSFVWAFLTPQQNPMGRLLPRYDHRNMVYFVEELNRAMAEIIAPWRNCFFFDLNSCVSTFGRRFFQDDVASLINHNGMLGDADFKKDTDRLEGAWRASEMFPLRKSEILQAIWQEHVAMYRTVRQVDQVKLVITDLDDTLWRGVAAEQAELSLGDAVEGWPIAYAEALHYLRRRGVLLAVASKNDEAGVLDIWKKLYSEKLTPADFAALKINWRPKTENIAEILAQVNLLPENVVFIDDNPVERAAAEAAFPGIRTMGSNPLLWRRALLWGSETQVPSVTAESSVRTEMVKAQVEREEHRQRLSRAEFLESLSVEIELLEIGDAQHQAFPRALELVNKTNQFNTTGRRWTEQQFRQSFSEGVRVFAFKVRDRFTSYGVVAAVIVEAGHIKQFVMSCRVAGMDVELAAVAKVVEAIGNSGFESVTADVVDTPANLVCRNLFELSGFDPGSEGVWIRGTLPPPAVPAHAHLVSPAPAAAAII